jgi:DNA-binding MarR family transcriptional regulator
VTADDEREALRLWLRMLAATQSIERELRRRLRAGFGTTLPRFDVMAALDRAPDGLTMGDLSRRLMIANGNTTVIVDGLERDGLAARTVAPEDRRRFTVMLTERGRASFAEMASAHATWVAELLGDVAAPDVETLSRLLHDVRVAVLATVSEREAQA